MYGSEEMYRYMQPRGGGYAPEYAGISQTLNQADRASDRNRHDIERIGDDYAAHQRDMGEKLARLPGQAIDAYRDARRFKTEEERAQWDQRFAEQRHQGNDYTLAGQKRDMERGQREDAFGQEQTPNGKTRERNLMELGYNKPFKEDDRGDYRFSEEQKTDTRNEESHKANLRLIDQQIRSAQALASQGNRDRAMQEAEIAYRAVYAMPEGPEKEKKFAEISATFKSLSGPLAAGLRAGGQAAYNGSQMLLQQGQPAYAAGQRDIEALDDNAKAIAGLTDAMSNYQQNSTRFSPFTNTAADDAETEFKRLAPALGVDKQTEGFDWHRPTENTSARMQKAVKDKIADLETQLGRVQPQMMNDPRVQNVQRTVAQLKQKVGMDPTKPASQQGATGTFQGQKNGSLLIHGGGLPQMSQQNGTFLTSGQQGGGQGGAAGGYQAPIQLPGYNMQASGASMRQSAPQQYQQQQAPGNPAATWNAPNPNNYRSDPLKINFQGPQPGAR